MIRLWNLAKIPSTSCSQWRPLYAIPSRSLVVRSPAQKAVAPSAEVLPEVGGISHPEAQSKIDMRNTKVAYSSKGSAELVRAYLVFRMCSYDFLLRNQKQLLNMARKVLGQRLFRGLMRMSIYGQFMAGQDQEQILQVARTHHQFGVRPMFAYTSSEGHGLAEGMVGSTMNEEVWRINYEALQKAIAMAQLSPRLPNEYVKVTGKLTAVGSSEIFRSTTTLIDTNTKTVTLALSKANQSEHWKSVLDHLEYIVTSEDQGSLSQVAKEMDFPIPSNFRSLDWRSLTTCLAFHLALSRSTKLAHLLKDAGGDGISHNPLSPEQEAELFTVWSRWDDLAERSRHADVCLVVDAEQTYLQLAMDLLAIDLMRRHNTERPVVHNTYQCYLTRTYDIITRDLTSADAEGFKLGAKVVRGGYMDEERDLAVKHGYPDPVNPTFEATTAMYYRVAEELLQRHVKGTTLQATFATHNEETVKHILNLMKQYNITMDPNVFAFAQLLGMRDHVAFILGQANLPAKKLLHYGSVEDCVAYLSRRVTENRAGVPTANVEREMLGAEIRRRMRAGEFFRRKSVQKVEPGS